MEHNILNVRREENFIILFILKKTLQSCAAD